MSYEMCKRIVLDEKNNKIKLTIASNNVRPITYSACDYYKDYDYTFEDKLLCLFWDMTSGMLQISTINSNTENFEYAIKKVNEYCKQNNISTYDYWDLAGNLRTRKEFRYAGLYYNSYDKENWKVYAEWTKTQTREHVKEIENKAFIESLREIYGELFKVFKNALYEQIKGDFQVIYNNCYYVAKIGKYNRYYSRFSYGGYTPLKMSYKQAYIFVDDLSNYNLKIEKCEEVA